MIRPVITGGGLVAAAAAGGSAWELVMRGEPASGRFAPGEDGAEFPAIGLPEEYRPHEGIPRNVVHFLDRGSVLALDAAFRALELAGLGPGAGDARRFAVADGLAYRAPGQAALFVPYGYLIARTFGVRGPVVAVGGCEASGMAALVAAARLVARGDADVVIAGAAQALQRPLLEYLSGQLGERALPFDRQHAGMVPAEGAAYVIVESEEHARSRGARMRARIAGAAEIFDPATEPTALPGATEAGRAMQAILGDGGYLQNQVDLHVSCGDGRPAMDVADGFGALRTFGRHAYYADVTAAAGSLGQLLAASGPAAVVLALEAMERSEVWPIGGLSEPIEGLELAFVRAAKSAKVDCAMVTSLGTGGIAAGLLLTRE